MPSTSVREVQVRPSLTATAAQVCMAMGFDRTAYTRLARRHEKHDIRASDRRARDGTERVRCAVERPLLTRQGAETASAHRQPFRFNKIRVTAFIAALSGSR